MATVYAVASAKGGVGKTTTTAAIAMILADSGADVVAIDADIGMANLAGSLGVTPGETTLHDVLAGQADPLDAVHDGPAGLRVVPGATDLDAYAAADPSGLTAVVDAFEDADYVFIDAGAGLSHDSTLPLGLADETLLVSTAERSALGDTEKTRQLTERLGGSVAGVAITRVDDGADEASGSEGGIIADLLDATVLGRIPEDDAVLRAAEAAAPLASFAPDSRATRAYRDLTRALTGEAIDGVGLAVGASAAEAADDEENDDTDESGASDAKESGSNEEIIVADSEGGGLGEPGDEDAIIVADDHVDGDDLAEMVEADDDQTAGFDEEEAADDPAEGDVADDDAIADADEVASQAAEPDAEAADGIATDDETGEVDESSESSETGGSSDDIDDELAGSIPFRDDDTGAMNAALSESESGSDTDESDDGSGEPDETDEADKPEAEKSGGFFSRLLGR